MSKRVLVLALVPALLVACGSDDAEPAADASSSGTTLTIEDFTFSPTPLKVGPGATVSVTNDDSTDHTVTADDSSFDTGRFQGRRTFTAPSEAGTYDYHCDIHDYMKGVIQVAE